MDVYTVTPATTGVSTDSSYAARLRQAGLATESMSWSGMLVPHHLDDVDPWMVACHLGSVTSKLIPLLAVQPACVPPHMAASCAAAYAVLYGRPLHFNLITGAKEEELRQLGDTTDHDQRYLRIKEYGSILRTLLTGNSVNMVGKYYTYRGYRLNPRPSVLDECKIFIAGSSPASLDAAQKMADVVVTHPLPFQEWRTNFITLPSRDESQLQLGIRIGIISRQSEDEAWETAFKRFPQSWSGDQITMLKTLSTNVWSRELAERSMNGPGDGSPRNEERDVYWLGAFRSGLASAPFFVGTYDRVAERIEQYTTAGVSHILLDSVENEDYVHINIALQRIDSLRE